MFAMEIIRYFWICFILLPVTVTAINFSFDKERVLLGSTGTLTMTCDITETDVETVFLIQIMRIKSTTLSGVDKNDWETLALMELSKNESPTLDPNINAATKDYVTGGSWDSDTPSNSHLTVSMNMEKLVCDDARYYRCALSYKSTTSNIVKIEKNGTFSAYVKPQVNSLIVRKNGFIVQGLSPTDTAAVNVGDELELTCTANIGSLPGTIIRWHRTNETAKDNEFIDYQPPQGTFNEGTETSDNQCGYTRVAKITYNATAVDANRDNQLAFECFVTVSGDPYGNFYTSENNPRFYADVIGPDGGQSGASESTSVGPDGGQSGASESTSGAPTVQTSPHTADNDQISVSLGVIVGIVMASMTVGFLIGVVFTWVIMRRMKTSKGSKEQNQRQPRESREMGSVISTPTFQSPYESLEQGSRIPHTYADLR